jgi:hypothetical protein
MDPDLDLIVWIWIWIGRTPCVNHICRTTYQRKVRQDRTLRSAWRAGKSTSRMDLPGHEDRVDQEPDLERLDLDLEWADTM